MAKPRKYTAEFKSEAVQMMRNSNVPVSSNASVLRINANNLGRRGRELLETGGKAFQGLRNTRDEEIAALKCELARVKNEREFLDEAVAFFLIASTNEAPHERAYPHPEFLTAWPRPHVTGKATGHPDVIEGYKRQQAMPLSNLTPKQVSVFCDAMCSRLHDRRSNI